MHLGVAITVAALCLWQPQPRLPRAASRGHRRAAAPLLCADDASSDWRRRDVLRAAAASALTAGGLPAAFAAAAPPAETVRQIDALVWRQAGTGTAGATPGCSAASAGTAFGPKFVNYLSRFLLSYDIPSHRLWRARAAEIPIAWNKKQVAEARFQHLGEFAGAVEAALCAYTPESGKWSDPLLPQEAAKVRQLLTLLRSRYGDRPDALRQLALLFSLLPSGVQPTSSIAQMVAEQEDREAAAIIVLDGGSLILSDAALAAPELALGPPALPRPAWVPSRITGKAASAERLSASAAAEQPRLRATGRVVTVAVTNGGAGYDDAKPPLVSITAPYVGTSTSASSEAAAARAGDRAGDKTTLKYEPWRVGRRAATARAIVSGGTVVAIELIDVGAGYGGGDRPIVVIAPPPKVKAGRDEERARRLAAEARSAGGAVGASGGTRALARSNTTCTGTTCVRVPVSAPRKGDAKAKAKKDANKATAKGLLEYEVASVQLSSRGMGYGSSQDLDLRFFKPNAPGNGDARPKRIDATSRRSDVSSEYNQDRLAVDKLPAVKDVAVKDEAESRRGPNAAKSRDAARVGAVRRGARDVNPDRSFEELSEAQLAANPWSLDSMQAMYGDRVSARSNPDVVVLKPPRATLVLGRRGARARADSARALGLGMAPPLAVNAVGAPSTPGGLKSSGIIGGLPPLVLGSGGLGGLMEPSRGTVAYAEPPLPQPPPLPGSGGGNVELGGAIERLISLLPTGEGAPILDPGRPPSPKYPLGVLPSHRFPSQLFERINPDYVARAPLGLPGLGKKKSSVLSAIPTAITGGIRKDVPLSIGLVARLALAGGLCSAVTKAVTSPIELTKTRAQAAGMAAVGNAEVLADPNEVPADPASEVEVPPQAPSSGSPAQVAPSTAPDVPPASQTPESATATAAKTAAWLGIVAAPDATGATTGTVAAGMSEPASEPVGFPEPSPWLGLDCSVACGMAQGAGSFGTFEFLKRALPQVATSILGPSAPAELSTPILLTACLLQAVAASACLSPFETSRAVVMAGVGEAPPTTLLEALQSTMAVPALMPAAESDDGSHDHDGPGGGEGAEAGAVAEGDDLMEKLGRLGKLWDGFPTLLAREIPFGVTKLLVYAGTQNALLDFYPAARERPAFALAISLISGVAAGLLGAFVSHPADVIVTKLSIEGSTDPVAAVKSILATAPEDAPPQEKVGLFYTGVQQRCISMAILVTVQFVLFDGLRAVLAVSKEDLSLALDVFTNGADPFSAWDEVGQSWADVFTDKLDNDLEMRK